MITKRDIIRLADALRAVRPVSEVDAMDAAALTQWEVDRDRIADAIGASNPRFDRDLFSRYVRGECGPNGGKIS